MEISFSPWQHWKYRNQYHGIAYPGIYIISISKENISNQLFSFRNDVAYIGMTNAVAGLRGRLIQFDNTIAQKHCQHGGADRFLYKHQDYSVLTNNLYVALWHIECKPAEEKPSDLRAMGEVANAEFECMALYVEEFGRLPEFNQKKESRKYSLTYGRS